MAANENLLSQGAKNLLASVRGLFGANNIIVTSTGRDAAHNSTIRGASNTSQHIVRNGQLSEAFDFKVRNRSPEEVAAVIAASGISYGQNIAERGLGMGPRNHLSTTTRTSSENDNRISINGNYARVGNSTLEKYLPKNVADIISRAGFRIGSAIKLPGDTLNTAIKTGEEAIDSELSSFFFGYAKQITFILLALIFIAIALVSLANAKNPITKSVRKAVLR